MIPTTCTGSIAQVILSLVQERSESDGVMVTCKPSTRFGARKTPIAPRSALLIQPIESPLNRKPSPLPTFRSPKRSPAQLKSGLPFIFSTYHHNVSVSLASLDLNYHSLIPNSFITTPTITVLIGPPSSRTEVSVHRPLAIARSEFIARALSGNWSNSDTNTVDLHSVLPNMDSEHLAHYLEELYSTTPSLKSGHTIYDIIHIYIVAEALLDWETRNRAIRSLHEAMFGGAGEDLSGNIQLVAKIYAHTSSSDNPMRRLFVDAWYDVAKSDWFDYETAPKEFLWDLQMKGFERAKSSTPLDAKYDVEEYMELTEEEMKEKEAREEEMRLMREKEERKEKLREMARQAAQPRTYGSTRAFFDQTADVGSDDEEEEEQDEYDARGTGAGIREFFDQTADVGNESEEDEMEDELFGPVGGENDDEMDDELFGPVGVVDEDGGIDNETFPIAGGEAEGDGIDEYMPSDGEYDSLSDEEPSDHE